MVKVFNMITDKPSLTDVIKSVLASFFGVQSDKNRKRDFEQGNPMHFIAIGLALTIVFILIMFAVVKLILHLST